MAQTFNTSLKNVAAQYIRLMKVNVTQTSIKRAIEENLHFPSLLSLTEAFSHYNISNQAFEIKPENFDRLRPPFVAYMRLPNIGKDFVLVTGLSDKKITYLHKSKRAHTLLKEEFLRKYQNIVWVAESDGRSGEVDFDKKHRREKLKTNKKAAWVAGAVFLLLTAFLFNLTAGNIFSYSSITLIKFIGTTAAVLLVVYENNKENSFVKNICGAGRQTNCDAILNSKASKIMGISWSEIGLFYFTSSTIWLLFPNIGFGEKISWLAVINVLAVPYTVFSIYYQWLIAKQWCPLCLTVQLVLLAELTWSVLNFWTGPQRPFGAAGIIFGLIAASVILVWYGLKPLIVKVNTAGFYETAYKRLQYSPEVFKGLLQQQVKAPDGWQQIGIDVGNPAARHTIIKVCNPYCGPCAKAHPHLEEIIRDREDVKLKVIFTAKNKEQDRGVIVVKHLLRIAAEGNSLKTQASLDAWYLAERKDYEAFAAKYPLPPIGNGIDDQVEAMGKWCQQAEIAFTPTIFLNGFRLPEGYGAEELKQFFQRPGNENSL